MQELGSPETMSHAMLGDPQAVLRLVSVPPIGNALLSSTPFGGKIEVALRLAQLEYTAEVQPISNKKLVPKGKYPVLRHGENVVPDSSTIFEYLHNTYPKQMSIFQPPDDKTAAVAASLQRMLEEHSYFAACFSLWQQKEVARAYCPAVIAAIMPLPSFIAAFLTMLGRRQVIRDLYGQGLGRHSNEEVRHRLRQDLTACASLLESSGDYLTGSSPCQADCFLFALAHLAHEAYLDLPCQPLFAEELLRQPALTAFYDRMRPRVFPEGTEGASPLGWSQKKRGGAGTAEASAAPAPLLARLPVKVLAAVAAVVAGVLSVAYLRS